MGGAEDEAGNPAHGSLVHFDDALLGGNGPAGVGLADVALGGDVSMASCRPMAHIAAPVVSSGLFGWSRKKCRPPVAFCTRAMPRASAWRSRTKPSK